MYFSFLTSRVVIEMLDYTPGRVFVHALSNAPVIVPSYFTGLDFRGGLVINEMVRIEKTPCILKACYILVYTNLHIANYLKRKYKKTIC